MSPRCRLTRFLAEGEWSPTCKRLGVTKSIDRFTTAIGLVINMVIDPNEPATKDPNMRSFTISPLDDVGRALKAAKLDFEFGEYLKGETHYIVLTIKKATLLAHGVLREDLPGANLLTKTNLDEPKLMDLSRRVATIIGLPESVAFTDFHPAKLFDFSTRARCLAPFRILAVRSGGARAGQVAEWTSRRSPFSRTPRVSGTTALRSRRRRRWRSGTRRGRSSRRRSPTCRRRCSRAWRPPPTP